MTNKLLNIIDRYSGDLCFFVGAGISKPPPTGLPLSNEIKKELVKCLSLVDAGMMQDLYLSNKEVINSKIDDILMEEIFEYIRGEIHEAALIPLEIFRKGEPNFYHRVLGYLLSSGKIRAIFTTNFDTHIENCVERKKISIQKGENFRVIDKPTMYKLHGSVENEQSIIHTLSQVGKGLSKDKKKILRWFLQKYPFVFVGWKDEDIDITPVLYEGNNRFYWYSYSGKVSDEVRTLVNFVHKGKILTNPQEDFIYLYKYLFNEEWNTQTVRLKIDFSDWAKSIPKIERMLILSRIFFEIELYECAKVLYEELIEYYKKINDQNGIARMKTNLANVFYRRGEMKKAYRAINDAIIEFKRTGEMEDTAIALLNLAVYYLDVGRFDMTSKILDEYEHIIENESLETEDHRLLRAFTYGNYFMATGDWVKSEQAFFDALNIAKNMGDVISQAIAMENLALLYSMKHDLKQSKKYFNHAYSLFKKLGEIQKFKTMLLNKANILIKTGYYREAKRIYNELLNSPEGLLPWMKAALKINLGIIHFETGHLSKALSFFEDAKRIDEKIGDTHGLAEVEGNIGNILLKLGRISEARRHLLQSIEKFRSINDTRGLIQAYSNLGGYFLTIEKTRKAIKHYAEVIRLSRALNDEYHEASGLVNIAICYMKLNKLNEAEKNLKKAHKIAEKLENLHLLSIVESNFGHLCEKLCRLQESYLHHEADLKYAIERRDNVAAALAEINLGRINILVGHPNKAMDYLEDAEQRLAKTDLIDDKISVLINKGIAYNIMGDKDRALIEYKKALKLAKRDDDINLIKRKIIQIENK